MEIKINLPFLAFLSVAIVVSHAALPSEEYWNSVLPNTPMPKAVKDLLHPTSEWVEDRSISVDPTRNLLYGYGYQDVQRHYDPSVAIFFQERDLYAGNKMTLHFPKPKNHKMFLPRHVADSVPFSSSKLPEIYAEFSVKPGSDEAEAIKETLQDCERKLMIKGEERFCATSLESMIDFSTSVLGEDVAAVSTEADSAEKKVYRIEAVTRLPSDKPVVSCHKTPYPHAVFYCHKIDATAVYAVSLVGAGGAKAEAVAVCHRDTSQWHPNHLAFRMLKVKPGSVPICHYMPSDHIACVIVTAIKHKYLYLGGLICKLP